MTEAELNLWRRYGQGDETARQELILFYLPLAKFWAKQISRSAGWANGEDLRQEAVIGLMKAIEKYDLRRGVAFKNFARPYIRGAIFDSSELTRDLARQQEERYRKVKQAEPELMHTLQRLPTIAEVAAKTGLSVEQIRKAMEAVGIAFAAEFPANQDDAAAVGMLIPSPERAAILDDALAALNQRDQEIINLFYREDLTDKEIAAKLKFTVSKVAKLRQRAIKKLRERLEVNKRGGQDEDRRSGK
ncbi:MAG: sigma-70 family RNA polymerase sigma factor [Acidobacteria bacterium]|nr:sigma-70 family RNA polymerase sigma factor [Acidobacteriota bacterium]